MPYSAVQELFSLSRSRNLIVVDQSFIESFLEAEYMKNIDNFQIEVQRLLLGWFEDNKRIFPWRLTRDPYHIIVAEILLQQTKVSGNVIIAYNTITTNYKNIQELSKAKIIDLENIIRPLGLIYRAKVFIKLTNEIIEKHNGIIPNDLKSLLSIFGIGDYIARAVLSFAFGKDIAIVDTNVARFIHRIFGLTKNITMNPARDTLLREYAGKLIPTGYSREFNYAILDLCALICKSLLPNCSSCPLQNYCEFNLSLKLYKQ